MIPVSLTTLIMLSMVIGVGLLSLSWVVAIVIERRNSRRARRDLIQCRMLRYAACSCHAHIC